MTASSRHPAPSGTLAALRAALLACTALLAMPASAGATDPRAAEIEALLDRNMADEAEELAREALTEAEGRLAERALEAANFHRLLGDALYGQNRFEEAEPHFRKAMSLREEYLGEHADTAVSVADLAYTLRQLRRYEEAEPHYRRALDIRIAVLGPGDAETARSWQRLAALVHLRGDHRRAAGLMTEAIRAGTAAFRARDETVARWRADRAAMHHDAGDHDAAEADYRAVIEAADTGILMQQGPEEASAQTGLANLLRSRGRFAEAEPLYFAALATRERMHGPVHATVAWIVENIGMLYERQGRGADALPYYRRALTIRDTVEGDFNAWSANLLFRTGTVLRGLDRPEDAERAFRRLLTMRETLDGRDAASLAEVWRALASVASTLNRKAEAEHAYKRALEIDEAHLPADHIFVGFDLLALGMHYSGQQRFTEARPLLERAVAIFEGNESYRASLPSARAALASLLYVEGDLDGAADLVRRSLDQVREDGGPPEMFALVSMVMADLRMRQKRWDDAEVHIGQAASILERIAPDGRDFLRTLTLRGELANGRGDVQGALGYHRQALDRLEAMYGPDHSETISARFEVGRALFALGDFEAAAGRLAASAAIVERLSAVDAATTFATRTGEIEDQALARGAIFDGLTKTYARLYERDPADAAPAEKAFLVSQRVIESEAAHALAQMAARQAAGAGARAALARDRQDAVSRWRRVDAKLTAALAVAPESRDAAAVAALRAELDAADAAIAAVDARLAAEFPDFAELQRPAPIDFAAVRGRLGDDDVLLFFADTAAFGDAGWETYLWAVPKTGEPRWVRLPRSTGDLVTAVHELRRLMGVAGAARGAASLAVAEGRDRPASVLAAAHALYGATLAPVADMIAGRNLVVVPSKRLAGLPFHLLVNALPARDSADRWRDAGWVALDHAITVVPSVSALGGSSGGAARRDDAVAYLGFANPLLTGRSGADRRAFGRDACAGLEPLPLATAAAADAPELSSLFRGAVADIEAVRLLEPLPETADEACAIASALGVGGEGVRLGETATEAEVKRLSGTGELARARILHFATHGLVSGELKGLAEPAIVMTPPAEATEADDGLLTASEVATLRLDADWVILSACNTAAGADAESGGGEALSGLARAFFYAGARSLMVSHWPVASDAAVRLATGAVDAMARDASLSRAEALRRAMAAEIAAGGRRADPANWAPFVVVGG